MRLGMEIVGALTIGPSPLTGRGKRRILNMWVRLQSNIAPWAGSCRAGLIAETS